MSALYPRRQFFITTAVRTSNPAFSTLVCTHQDAAVIGIIAVTEREAEKQKLASRNSELNFEKDTLEKRAAELNAALAVNITHTVLVCSYQHCFLMHLTVSYCNF
jgi:hypothetical protein